MTGQTKRLRKGGIMAKSKRPDQSNRDQRAATLRRVHAELVRRGVTRRQVRAAAEAEAERLELAPVPDRLRDLRARIAASRVLAGAMVSRGAKYAGIVTGFRDEARSMLGGSLTLPAIPALTGDALTDLGELEGWCIEAKRAAEAEAEALAGSDWITVAEAVSLYRHHVLEALAVEGVEDHTIRARIHSATKPRKNGQAIRKRSRTFNRGDVLAYCFARRDEGLET